MYAYSKIEHWLDSAWYVILQQCLEYTNLHERHFITEPPIDGFLGLGISTRSTVVIDILPPCLLHFSHWMKYVLIYIIHNYLFVFGMQQYFAELPCYLLPGNKSSFNSTAELVWKQLKYNWNTQPETVSGPGKWVHNPFFPVSVQVHVPVQVQCERFSLKPYNTFFLVQVLVLETANVNTPWEERKEDQEKIEDDGRMCEECRCGRTKRTLCQTKYFTEGPAKRHDCSRNTILYYIIYHWFHQVCWIQSKRFLIRKTLLLETPRFDPPNFINLDEGHRCWFCVSSDAWA